MFTFLVGLLAAIWPLVTPNLLAISFIVGGGLFWWFSPAGKSLGLIVALVAALVQGSFDYGVWKGETYVHERSAVVVQQGIKQAQKARSDAEKSVAAHPVKPAPSGLRAKLPHQRADKFDRG